MSFFSPQKSETEITLLFDISSRSIGAALVELSHKDKPKFLYTVRSPLSFKKAPKASELESTTLSELKKLNQTIEKEVLPKLISANQKIKEISLSFSAPWYVSQTKVLKLEKQEPFLFTPAILAEMLTHEKVATAETIASGVEIKDPHSLEILEQKIIQTRLNGYETAKPFGKKTLSAEVSVYTSFVPSVFIQKVKSLLSETFHSTQIEAHSFAVAAYSVIRDVYPDQNDFLLVDISGEMTEISVAKKGALLETISIPLGHNHLIRKISDVQESPKELAISFLHLHLQKRSDEKTKGTTEKSIENEKAEWKKAFQDGIKSLSGEQSIPKTVFLVAEKVFSPFFSASIEEEISGENELTEKDPSLRIIPLDIHSITNYSSQTHETKEDTSLFLEGVFLNKIFRG